MSENLVPFEPPAPVLPDAAVYTGPDDVVGDPSLTLAEKRAVLASWVSDARAIVNAPTLRRLDSGAVVEVASVLEALRALDRFSGVVVRLPTRSAYREDPDDDPPSTPARSGIPPRPIRVNAYGRLAALGERRGLRRSAGALVLARRIFARTCCEAGVRMKGSDNNFSCRRH